jgi:uncharacterized protein
MIEGPFLLLITLVFLSNVVEAVTGFGGSIIVVTIGASYFSIHDLVLTLVPVNIVLSAYISARHWRTIHTREFLTRILPAAGAGVLIGRTLFDVIPSEKLKYIFGVFIVVLSIVQTVRLVRTPADAPPQPKLRLPEGIAWLGAGGLMQGLCASGGPMVVYYASRSITDKAGFRSTLSLLWVTLNVFLTITYAAERQLTPAIIKTSALMLPSIIAGLIVGEIVHKRIPERAFRITVFVILLISGVFLLVGKR